MADGTDVAQGSDSSSGTTQWCYRYQKSNTEMETNQNTE